MDKKIFTIFMIIYFCLFKCNFPDISYLSETHKFKFKFLYNKTRVNGHDSQKDWKLAFKTNYCLIQVESIILSTFVKLPFVI